MAEAPAWQGRPLTGFTHDDGQDLTGLQFTPDGAHVLFVRGGAPNRQGEVPDPLSTADQEERAVWRVATTGGAPEKLMDAGGFALSPDGTRLVWSQGGDLHIRGMGAEDPVERLATTRGTVGSVTWSPDGTRLAFESARGDHAFIGVLDVEDRAVRYLLPSVFRDQSPVWSPDGARLAFLRIPNERVVHMFSPRRSALPFRIVVVDAATGEGREIWTAAPGPGSAFSGIGADRQLFWGSGNRIVFPWEADGWKHLYSVPAAGGDATLLTPGDFEVQFASLSPDGTRVLYDSNQGDLDRKHLWSVSVGGGTPRQVTEGTGIEWGAVMTAAGTVAFHASSASEPARTAVLVGGARRVVSPAPDDRFARLPLVQPEPVVFSAADGMPINGQLFRPPGARDGQRFPAVLFFHGGSRRQMLLGFHHRAYYHHAYAMNQALAAHGYVVLSVNYRSGIGYGMEFREAENYGASGASEFNDVLGAGLYLQTRPDVDPDRIGLWGGSYGGYLTALGLARASHLFKAGVDIHGVHDWNVVINGFRPSYEPEDFPEFAATAYASSPMAFIDGWRSPVLLIHGDDDRNVPFRESVDLAEQLLRRGVEFEQLVFPDEVHGFLLHANWVAAYRASLDFFQRRLKAPAS